MTNHIPPSNEDDTKRKMDTRNPVSHATPLTQVEQLLCEDFKNHEGWRNHPFVLLARKFANELMAAKAEIARLERNLEFVAGVRDRHVAMFNDEQSRAERTEAELSKVQVQLESVCNSMQREAEQYRETLIRITERAEKAEADNAQLRAEIERLNNVLAINKSDTDHIIISQRTNLVQLRAHAAELEKDKARLDKIDYPSFIDGGDQGYGYWSWEVTQKTGQPRYWEPKDLDPRPGIRAAIDAL